MVTMTVEGERVGCDVRVRRTPDDPPTHHITTVERRRRRRRTEGDARVTGSALPLDPFDEVAMAGERAWLQAGIDSGADPAELRAEIATRMWPWVQRFADRAARRLPRHADVAEVHSRVATALWQCCARFDPEPSPAWSVWLSVRLRGAVVDASRASDRLSRRDRRSVTDSTAAWHVVGAAAPTAPIDAAVERPDPHPEPERQVIDRALAAGVHRWIREELPPTVALELCTWWATTGATTTMPSALAAAIGPYRSRLARVTELLC
jgi:hypothetical protein